MAYPLQRLQFSIGKVGVAFKIHVEIVQNQAAPVHRKCMASPSDTHLLDIFSAYFSLRAANSEVAHWRLFFYTLLGGQSQAPYAHRREKCVRRKRGVGEIYCGFLHRSRLCLLST